MNTSFDLLEFRAALQYELRQYLDEQVVRMILERLLAGCHHELSDKQLERVALALPRGERCRPSSSQETICHPDDSERVANMLQRLANIASHTLACDEGKNSPYQVICDRVVTHLQLFPIPHIGNTPAYRRWREVSPASEYTQQPGRQTPNQSDLGKMDIPTHVFPLQSDL